jgi:CubicO group peptidase (beta-lactamase class C family)
MDLLDLLMLPGRPFKSLCRVPRDLAGVTVVGDEAQPAEVSASPEDVERVWSAAEALYRTGIHPAIQICIRRHGRIALHRAVGHTRGNAPGAPEKAPRERVGLDTPFLLYSASKALTAMVVHKLDERGVLDIEDRVCDYIPEFGSDGKQWITIRHILGHRAGIPNLPPEALDLDLLEDPERMVEVLCGLRRSYRPGRNLAYHAVSGGFVLGEVVRRATGSDVREVLRKEIAEPLGLHWLGFGVRPEDVSRVAEDAVTGLPVGAPFSWIFRRALGVGFEEVVELARDPRFLTGVIPAANAVASADELCAFYQCLLDGGEYQGARVFEPRTVRHATGEDSFLELDLTLGIPLRYGLGLMLGGPVSLLGGWNTRRAFGHLGFTNIVSWADPDRDLAVALLTSGKPFLSLDVARFAVLLQAIGSAFGPVERRRPTQKSREAGERAS